MNIKQILSIAVAIGSVVLCADSCGAPEGRPAQTAVDRQRQESIQRVSTEQTYCYECKNIERRRILFGKPGLIGYVAFLNQGGQPVAYYTIDGKCSSSTKKLEENYRAVFNQQPTGVPDKNELVPAAGEDGTYGSSDSYVYCFTTGGAYVQWNGNYMYSDKPFDMTIKPLVLTFGDKVTGQ